MSIRRIIVIIILIVVIAPLLVIIGKLWADYRGRCDFASLLAGDHSIFIKQVKIEGYKMGYKIKSIELHEPIVVNYLSEMFRSAKLREGDLSTSYDISLHLSTGSNVDCVLWVPATRKDQITLYFPLNTLGDPDKYAITLHEPVPDELKQVLDNIRD
jgi:hypothetical protein